MCTKIKSMSYTCSKFYHLNKIAHYFIDIYDLSGIVRLPTFEHFWVIRECVV